MRLERVRWGADWRDPQNGLLPQLLELPNEKLNPELLPPLKLKKLLPSPTAAVREFDKTGRVGVVQRIVEDIAVTVEALEVVFVVDVR